MDEYKTLEKIGQGTYGTVYLAENVRTHERVALKKMLFDSEDEIGITATALREVSLLKELSGHPTIVDLLDVIYTRRTLYLVFQFVDNDLQRHMAVTHLAEDDVQSFLWQLLNGVHFVHSRNVLHRDLKPQNILISGDGVVKLADFGLGRAYSPARDNGYTHEVVTLWYRAPELLLGSDDYDSAVDVWSLACIFAEMLTGTPLFPGDSEIDQLFRIFRTLGTPDASVWPAFTSMRNYQPIFPQYARQPLRAHYSAYVSKARRGEAAFDLLEAMLQYDPRRRLTARAALNARYFDDIRAHLGDDDRSADESSLEAECYSLDSALRGSVGQYHGEAKVPGQYNLPRRSGVIGGWIATELDF